MPSSGADWFVQLLIFVLIAYPIVGGLAFLVSSFYYHVFSERRDRPRYLEHGEPFVTILVPAHNEEASIESTVRYLETMLNYPSDKYEIIVVDDASTDRTAEILASLQGEYPDLRVVSIVKNRGKAQGFNVALAFARGDFLLSNDADTRPNPDALWQYLSYFEREGGQNVGAVTGNMLAANRTTLTAEAQQNELNSIIGLIKRSQMSYGGLFAFSGANTMYRRQAVLDVGGWHAEQPTEDIAIAWDMQSAGWRALFAAHIRFFLDVPEQTRSLVKQRRRWSSGGIYVLVSKGPALLRHPIRRWRMMPIVLDYSFSVFWSFLYWISMALFLLTQLLMAVTQNWERFWHNWYMVGIFVALQMVIGLVQLSAASYYNDGGRTLKYILFAPAYMLVYWMVNTWTVVVEFVPTVRKVWERRDGGSWKSPERSDSLQGTREVHGREPS
ncbi:glycosyl transferase [Nocardioides sp. Root1257]|uniref:glycosyltransferase n=1 Tax=unclassified Nocardioides TaxID=2615069 RepID=UPI0006F21DB5|nr:MULTISPECIES: glycosyltransferase [unclassified Nocardioides]KQW53089.1 glycosyl transferase [Nocardioides sp. Root1257]KRC55777.1 glycosyl transferase [Nocardioides sp. Root224]